MEKVPAESPRGEEPFITNTLVRFTVASISFYGNMNDITIWVFILWAKFQVKQASRLSSLQVWSFETTWMSQEARRTLLRRGLSSKQSLQLYWCQNDFPQFNSNYIRRHRCWVRENNFNPGLFCSSQGESSEKNQIKNVPNSKFSQIKSAFATTIWAVLITRFHGQLFQLNYRLSFVIGKCSFYKNTYHDNSYYDTLRIIALISCSAAFTVCR